MDSEPHMVSLWSYGFCALRYHLPVSSYCAVDVLYTSTPLAMYNMFELFIPSQFLTPVGCECVGVALGTVTLAALTS